MHQTLLEFGARDNIDIIILGQCCPHYLQAHVCVFQLCFNTELLSCHVHSKLLVALTIQY